MALCIKHKILFMVVISSVFISLPQAKGGCAVSGGGDSSTSFMGDRGTNIDMSSFDEFVRDNLGNDPQATLQAKSLSQDAPLNTNSSLNHSNGNLSQNRFAEIPLTNNTVNTTCDKKTINLGASGMQDHRLSTLAFAAFNNNMF